MFEHFTASDWIELGTAAVVVLAWLFRLEAAVKSTREAALAAVANTSTELTGQLRTERARVDGKFETTNRDVDLQIGFMRETMKRIEGLFHSINDKIDRRNEARPAERERWPGGGGGE